MNLKNWDKVYFLSTAIGLIIFSLILFTYVLLNPDKYVRLYEPNQIVAGIELIWMIIALIIGIFICKDIVKENNNEILQKLKKEELT